METRANTFLVGLFVLAAIAGSFGFVWWLMQGSDTTPRREVSVIFPSAVQGLVPGASVTFNGLKIGDVRRLGFAPDDPNKVVAIIAVDSTAPIRKDTTVQLSYSGLTGVATVDLRGGTASQPRLLEGNETPILSANASAMQDLMSVGRELAGRANATLVEVEKVVKENSDGIRQSVENVRQFTSALNSDPEAVRKLMADVGRASEVLSKVANRIDPLVEGLDGLVRAVDREQVKRFVDNATKVSADLAAVSGELGAVVKEMRALTAAIDPVKVRQSVDGISDLAARLQKGGPDIEKTIASAQQAAKNVETFSAELAKRSADVDSIVKNTSELTAKLNKAADRIDGVLAGIDGLVRSPEGQGLFAEGKTFLAEATRTAAQIRETAKAFDLRAAEIAGGINRLASSGLREVRDFVSDGRRALQTIDRTVGGIEKNPQQFLFGNKPVPEYQPNRR